MDKSEIIKSLGKKSNGEIYLGVVGAVRTGKSTFIKKCIETLILPYMMMILKRKDVWMKYHRLLKVKLL